MSLRPCDDTWWVSMQLEHVMPDINIFTAKFRANRMWTAVCTYGSLKLSKDSGSSVISCALHVYNEEGKAINSPMYYHSPSNELVVSIYVPYMIHSLWMVYSPSHSGETADHWVGNVHTIQYPHMRPYIKTSKAILHPWLTTPIHCHTHAHSSTHNIMHPLCTVFHTPMQHDVALMHMNPQIHTGSMYIAQSRANKCSTHANMYTCPHKHTRTLLHCTSINVNVPVLGHYEWKSRVVMSWVLHNCQWWYIQQAQLKHVLILAAPSANNTSVHPH